MIVYGIKNCDTMQKALRFLEAEKQIFHFHNYKVNGIDAIIIKRWLNLYPIELLINTKGLTFKKLTDTQKASIHLKSKAIEMMTESPSMIKRPILELRNGNILLGFNEIEWKNALNG